MATIAIDARAYSWEGIGRYTRNLLSGLRYDNKNKYIVLLQKDDVVDFEKRYGENIFEVEIVDGVYYSWREQFVFLRQINKIKADLFHFTHFNVPIFFKHPYVVTIHDTTRFIFPGQKKQTLLHQLAYEYVFKKAVEGAGAVITVSESTKKELQSLPLRLPKIVKMIYEGVDSIFLKPIKERDRRRLRMTIGTNHPYLLFVGVWMGHKNLRRLIKAFAILSKKYPELRLVITGRPKPGYDKIIKVAHDMGVHDKIVFPGFVQHDLMPALYSESKCFVFPSLYEGFGLPVLEAAACGCPVVTSNVSSLPEIMAAAAMYVNPESVVSIVRGIEKVLDDEEVSDSLIQKGILQASMFSWRETVAEHLKVYEKAVL